MSNQLSLPFKKTWEIDIKSSVSTYVRYQLDANPETYKWDIGHWRKLRKDAVKDVVHADRVAIILNYHAQLLSVLSKFPPDIQLDISYAPAFFSSDVPVTLSNLAFERAALLFNLAALYSQLAASEDRTSREGAKRAIASFQNAAGVLSFLISSAIPQLSLAPHEGDIPWDLTESFVKSLEWLMLAQAQECVWQRARRDNSSYSNSVVAKLATSVSSLYRSSLEAINNASPSIKNKFLPGWTSHLEAKQWHFAAAAQYRKSIDDEGSRYGIELARLSQAGIDVKKAYDFARISSISPGVLQDAKTLLDVVQKNYQRAERDNDLIYHQDVPATSTLEPIQEAMMVNRTVPPELLNPRSAIGDENMLFKELSGWGAREAINIYDDNKNNLIEEKIVDVAHELDKKAEDALRSRNLPASLEALEKPIGLPPSILKKAEEVRAEEGPTRIETSIEDRRKLAEQNMNILNEAMDILDHEVSEDEAARKDGPIGRPPSHEANEALVKKEKQYRSILERAVASDELVTRKWDQWEANIRELTWDEAQLTESVPSSTGSADTRNSQSYIHARALRGHLESLDNIKRSRAEIVERAQRVAGRDVIKDRILQAAEGFEHLDEVKPVVFEDIVDEELAKYDKFLLELIENEEKQNDILVSIRTCNEQFLKSRKEDVSVKEREHALQSLNMAYQKYREITQNLDEGLKFYNDIAGILIEFKETCRGWSNSRKQEIHELSRTLRSASLSDRHTTDAVRSPKIPSPEPKATSSARIPSFSFPPPPPPLDSDEWVNVPLPPAPQVKPRQAADRSSDKKRRAMEPA